jgi:DNA invertase Pin-like site-specific DNA recombinase
MVGKLDRLARSVAHLVEITEAVQKKAAHLQVLAMGLHTAGATGRLMLHVLGAVAQFERECMLERQREGIAKAKAEGKYKGRKPTARAKAGDIAALRGKGHRPAEGEVLNLLGKGLGCTLV